jgi:antitoxin VapB
MPLYIRDEKVDDLANELMKITGAKTKTDAVRTALIKQIAATKDKVPLLERIKPSIALVANIGTPDPDFDQKRFSDDLYEGM